jgi:flagellar biosynthesis/type III secretory pathway protein FliH
LAKAAARKEGEAEGRAIGRAEGIKEGEAEGIAEGRAEAARNCVLVVLRKRFTNVSYEMEQAIRQMNDPIALDPLYSYALDCRTLDEFATALK